jgi:RNA polymerase sigma-70 factor (ECF subfamily)
MESAARASASTEDDRRALLDDESSAWLRDLRADGNVREEAVERLHALLLRAARFETGRRRASHPHLRGDLDEIAQEAADDALLAVLARLDDYRGLSRFTTWVYKFALYQASVKVRRRSWQGREVPVEDEAWSVFASAGSLPEDEVEQSELLGAIRDGIRTALTPHQRSVLVALALNDVPIDVLAERGPIHRIAPSPERSGLSARRSAARRASSCSTAMSSSRSKAPTPTRRSRASAPISRGARPATRSTPACWPSSPPRQVAGEPLREKYARAMRTLTFDEGEIAAVRSYLDDFGHEEADLLRRVKQLLAKLQEQASQPA